MKNGVMGEAVDGTDGHGRFVVLNLLSVLDETESVVQVADVSTSFHQGLVAALQHNVLGSGDTQDTDVRLVYHALLQWVSYANLHQS